MGKDNINFINSKISKNLNKATPPTSKHLYNIDIGLNGSRARQVHKCLRFNDFTFLKSKFINFKQSKNYSGVPLFPSQLFHFDERCILSLKTVITDIPSSEQFKNYIDFLHPAYTTFKRIPSHIQTVLESEENILPSSTDKKILEDINLWFYRVYIDISDNLTEENILKFSLFLNSIPTDFLDVETGKSINVLKSFISSILFIYSCIPKKIS